MRKKIDEKQLRKHAGLILQSVEKGASFVIMRDSVPVAELRPPRSQSPFVSVAEMDAMASILPSIDREEFRADVDSAADQEAFDRWRFD